MKPATTKPHFKLSANTAPFALKPPVGATGDDVKDIKKANGIHPKLPLDDFIAKLDCYDRGKANTQSKQNIDEINTELSHAILLDRIHEVVPIFNRGIKLNYLDHEFIGRTVFALGIFNGLEAAKQFYLKAIAKGFIHAQVTNQMVRLADAYNDKDLLVFVDDQIKAHPELINPDIKKRMEIVRNNLKDTTKRLTPRMVLPRSISTFFPKIQINCPESIKMIHIAMNTIAKNPDMTITHAFGAIKNSMKLIDDLAVGGDIAAIAAQQSPMYGLAQYHLGVFLLNSKDIRLNGIQLLEAAKTKGVPSAWLILGCLYFKGSHVEQDKNYAKALWKGAALLGVQAAADYLKEHFPDEKRVASCRP